MKNYGYQKLQLSQKKIKAKQSYTNLMHLLGDIAKDYLQHVGTYN